jgi:hypothetical protein
LAISVLDKPVIFDIISASMPFSILKCYLITQVRGEKKLMPEQIHDGWIAA